MLSTGQQFTKFKILIEIFSARIIFNNSIKMKNYLYLQKKKKKKEKKTLFKIGLNIKTNYCQY